MSLGKLVTLGVLGALGWQHQALLKDKLQLVRHTVPTFQTYRAMRAIRSPLAKYAQEHGGRYPSNVNAWIAESVDGRGNENVGHDFWGNPYRISREPDREYYLRSCGPDGACGTEDDLLVKIGRPLSR